MLNPDSPLPLYHQLAEILTEQIRSDRYMPGDLMPSETGLAKQYGIGRPTVRQAMDQLVRKGLVLRKRGAGTFVSPRRNQVNLFSLGGTSQAFSTRGIKTDTRIVDPIRIEGVENDSANPFNEREAFFMSRLTLVKEKPVLFEVFYFNPQLFPGLDTLDLDNRSLSSVVWDQYYLRPDNGHQRFKVTCVEDVVARLLELQPGSAILEVERTLDFPNAEGAVFSRLFCLTDQFAFSQTINLKNNI